MFATNYRSIGSYSRIACMSCGDFEGGELEVVENRAGSPTCSIWRLNAVVQFKLNWVSCLLYKVNFFHFQVDVRFDHVVGENAAAS